MLSRPISIWSRGQIEIAPDATEADALETLKRDESLAKRIDGKEIKKAIYVPGRILNIIVQE